MKTRTQKGLGAVGIIVIVLFVLLLVFGAWFFWRFFLSGGSSVNVPSSSTSSPASSKIDSALVGKWESDCLVPAPTNSKWAEKHYFEIKADGTATHMRKSWGMIDCTTLQPENTITSQFKLTIPSSGKINLTYTGYNNPEMSASGEVTVGNTTYKAGSFVGNTIYDIYSASALSLKFGHGFRNNEAYGGKSGGSEADRFDTLNEYIVYQKK